MIPYFIPFKRVGDFEIGHEINIAITDYEFDFLPKVKDYEADHYSINNPEITLFVHNKIIESIGCYDECIYKGRNLIGMTIEEFISHTGEKYYGEIDVLDYEDDGVPQYVYEFDDIGLQVWCKNDKIVTVIASAYIEDEEE